MKIKPLFKHHMVLLFTLIGTLLCMTVAYASPNVKEQVLSWADNRTKEAELQIKTAMLGAIEKQFSLIEDQSETLLNKSENDLKDISMLETESTSEFIQTLANAHISTLQNASIDIKKKSNEDMNEIVSDIHTISEKTLSSINIEPQKHLGELTSPSLLQQDGTLANQELAKEIEATLSTIEKLKKLKEQEQNQEIREFIQRKINLLDQLILVLTTE